MSSVVEKNDVDITPLFNWSKQFEVVLEDNKIPVYMRVVGDSDLNKAKVASLRRSADMRRKLRDDNSDERMAYIRDIEDLDEERLISTITVFSMRDLAEKTRQEVKVPAPKAPRSDAKTEAHEKYQAELDDYPNKVQAKVKKVLEDKVEKLRETLKEESKESLYKKYVTIMTDELCEQELLTAFKEWTAYLSAYKDEDLTERLFSSFDEFSNLPSDLKSQFIRWYSLIEMSNDELKKLQPVTQ